MAAPYFELSRTLFRVKEIGRSVHVQSALDERESDRHLAPVHVQDRCATVHQKHPEERSGSRNQRRDLIRGRLSSDPYMPQRFAPARRSRAAAQCWITDLESTPALKATAAISRSVVSSSCHCPEPSPRPLPGGMGLQFQFDRTVVLAAVVEACNVYGAKGI